MEEYVQSGDTNLGNIGADEEFRSCFGEDEDWQDADEFCSKGLIEGNEEVSLKIPKGNNEDGDAPYHREDVVESVIFSDALEEIVSEGSLILLEGIDQQYISECSFSLFDDNDEVVSDCSLRLFEGGEEITSMCSLILSEVHGDDDDSECSVRLSEGENEVVVNFIRRSCEGQEDDILDLSLRLCECREEDVSECSLRSSEDGDVVSECSLIFSEDHENDILECPMRLFEKPDNDDDDDDGVLVRIFSKGVSFSVDGDLGSRTSGIGVVLEKTQGVPFLQVQKKLDFFVEEIIAEHLALMDGLLVALKNDCRKVLAFTDSDKVYRMITKTDMVEDQLLIALHERIQELTDKFEFFVLRQAPRSELKSPLQLAREATGAFCNLIKCSICGEDKPRPQMIEMCQVPCHSPMNSEEYQNLPLEERNSGDIASNQLVLVSSGRRCQQCRQLSELSEGCDRCAREFCFSCGTEYRHGTQTCRCETPEEHSESSPAPSEHETELWRWDCFNLLPGSIDGYTEQEKTQLSLIQRFLAGGIGFDGHNPYQSSPRSSDSYVDTFKDLNQLPWLESFISVIGDTYQEDHIY